MEPVAVVTVIALLEYFFFAVSAAGARQASGIEPPVMTGDVNFERHVRVHANTLEQLVLFLPGIWLFGYYVDALAAAAIGLVFVGARFWYRTAYVADPGKRGAPFIVGELAQGVLVLGGGIGAVWSWL